MTEKEKNPKSVQTDEMAFCLHEGDIRLYTFGREELYSDDYLKWMNDSEITRTLGRFDYLFPVDRAKLVDYFNAINKTNTVFLAIYLGRNVEPPPVCRADMQFIGTLKIYDIDLLAKRASLGIVIGDKSEWGKGYAGTAIRIACRYIFEVLGMRKITAGYVADNVGMERAFLNNGFEIEATFKEHLFFEGRYVDHKFVCLFRK